MSQVADWLGKIYLSSRESSQWKSHLNLVMKSLDLLTVLQGLREPDMGGDILR